MSFLKDLGQNLGQTMTNVAETVVERGQHLTSQAQLQLSLKKLQLERTRRLQDLGRRTYGWYQSGSLATAGTVPGDVTDLCRQIERLDQKLEENQRRLEEVKMQAQETHAAGDEPDAPPAPTALATLPPPDAASGTTGAPPTSTPPYGG
ncbi:MAG TPA: hypothetical protein VNA16_04620 [Abditibacteriaceae bacterium]|nr:hypothetical protein [Abditibacteriaceae bacterium]